MSKLLEDLLQAKQPLFSKALEQLEKASGNDGADVKLTADIIETFNAKVRELGLDPQDSTGEEIYNALLNLAKEHDEHLAAQIGGKDPDDVHEMVPLVIDVVNKTDMPRKVWVLKKSVAKTFLKETPPKKIMEILGYSSIDSMLKKENVSEIFAALRFAESDDWLNEFNTHYDRLTPSDFETRDIELVQMPKERWGDIAKKFIKKKRHLNTHVKEMGVVVLLPPTEDRMPGITSKVFSLTFHYYNEVRLYSAFFKMQQVKKDFGKIFVDTLLADADDTAVIAGQNVHWRVIQRYYGKLKDEYHPEIFEPHVQPEDLHWRKAEEQMYKVDPELAFWKDLDYVALMYEGKPLTMNLMDVSLSYSNGITYEDRYIYHFTESLWNEVFIRYMGSETLEEQVLKQLDNDMIEPENL